MIKNIYLWISFFLLCIQSQASELLYDPYPPVRAIYPKPFSETKYMGMEGAYLPLAAEILISWGLYHEEATDQLYQRCRSLDARDIFHILNLTCRIAARCDTAADKSAIALELSLFPYKEREQVAHMVSQLQNLDLINNKQRTTKDLIYALCAPPAYKRKSIFDFLKQPEAYQHKSAFACTLDILKKRNCLLDTWLQMQYWLIQPICSNLWLMGYNRPLPFFEEVVRSN